MEQKSESIESKVMGEIESGRVKVRSRYVFLAEKFGLGSAFVLSLLLAVLFFSLFFFYLRATDNLIYLGFGKYGVLAFLESFPYALVIMVVLLVLVGGFFLRKSDVSYKKPFRYFAVGMVLFMVAAGSALAYTRVVEVVEDQAYRYVPSVVFKPFFAVHARNRGVAGEIVSVANGTAVIQAPCGMVTVDTRMLSTDSKMMCVVGTFVVVAGQWQDDIFVADRLHTFDPDDLSLMARHIRRRLEPLPGHVPVPDHCH